MSGRGSGFDNHVAEIVGAAPLPPTFAGTVPFGVGVHPPRAKLSADHPADIALGGDSKARDMGRVSSMLASPDSSPVGCRSLR